MSFIYNFNELNELATYDVVPNIVKKATTIRFSVFSIKIDDDIYIVNIELFGSVERSFIKINFGIKTEDSISTALTNVGNPLLIMANIIGVIKYWLKLDMKDTYLDELVDFKDINITSIIIISKSEKLNDNRRSNLYDYYLSKNFKKMGINIIGKIDITNDYKKLLKLPKKALLVGNKYIIEPITIEEIRKKL